MKATYTAIAIVVALCVLSSADNLLMRPTPRSTSQSHTDIRDFIIRSQVGRTKSPPILIVGDSITEAAFLPSALCSAPVVNAGIGGAGVTTDFPFIIRRSLAGRKAKLIVIALGTNDAYETDATRFRTRYAAQVAHLKPYAEHMLLVSIPPLSTNHLNLMQDNVAPLNSAIEAVALDNELHVVSLRDLEEIQSLDGVHLSDAGYAVWDKKVSEGILHECNQDRAAAAARRSSSAK